jgi:hypothetical protein
MPVYLRNGKLLGHTVEIGHAVDYLHVQRGRILVRDWYIPIGGVVDVDARGIHLEADLSDLRHRRWYVPPEDYLLEQGATPGYEYATATDLRENGHTNMQKSSSEIE